MSADPEGDRARDRFAALLDQAAGRGLKLPFWWRDDDAEDVTPALARLLGLAARHAVPLALAVIPRGASEALSSAATVVPRVSVLQHGWQHKSHATTGEKKIELDAHRPLDTVLDELTRGHMRLQELFPHTFHPVLVPPWNRIADSVREARQNVQLPGLSTFGPVPAGEAHWVNTHLDIIDWAVRGPLPRATAYDVLARETERRLSGEPEPLGILTHHLVHQDASWDFLDELLALTARHPGVIWPSTEELFQLASA